MLVKYIVAGFISFLVSSVIFLIFFRRKVRKQDVINKKFEQELNELVDDRNRILGDAKDLLSNKNLPYAGTSCKPRDLAFFSNRFLKCA